MSLEALTYVWKNSKQKGSTLLILLALADSANGDTHSCYPGQPFLAKKGRMSTVYARKIIKKLEASKEISVVENGGIQTRGGWTNRYTIIIDGVNEWSERSKIDRKTNTNPPNHSIGLNTNPPNYSIGLKDATPLTIGANPPNHSITKPLVNHKDLKDSSQKS